MKLAKSFDNENGEKKELRFSWGKLRGENNFNVKLKNIFLEIFISDYS